MKLTSGAYESLRACFRIRREDRPTPANISWTLSAKIEDSGLEVEETIRVRDTTLGESYAFNMYHTRC